MASPAGSHPAFSHDFFHARAKVFDIAPKFFFYDMQGNKIGFLKQKLFKLKEDIRLYSDESMAQELLTVKARSILDFSTAYDVVDARDQSKVGVLKRKGWKSLVQDEWIIMDANDRDIGRIHEESMVMALLRRFLTGLIPQSFIFEVGGQRVGIAEQHFNPFIMKMDVDLREDKGRKLDRRLAAAAVVLLLAIERRQD